MLKFLCFTSRRKNAELDCSVPGSIAKADPHQNSRIEGGPASITSKMIPEEEIDWDFLGEN